MAKIFEYGFNLGGNFIAVMEGMIDSTGKFSAKIEDCNSWLGRLTNTFAAWDMASNYVEKISGVFNDITEAGASATFALILQQFYSLIFSPYRKRTNIFWETITMIILCFIHLTVLILRDFHDLIFSLSS